MPRLPLSVIAAEFALGCAVVLHIAAVSVMVIEATEQRIGGFRIVRSSPADVACTTTVAPDRTSVATAVTAAASGDKICVTAGDGTETWATPVTATKAMIVEGPGRDSLTITGSFVYSPTVAEASKTFELTGFTFSGNAGFDANAPNGTTAITGLKIHGNAFNNATSRAIPLDGLEFGVIYDNTFSNFEIAIGVNGAGDNGWNYTFGFGTANCLYVEDNDFGNGTGSFIVETGQGGRICFRHNTSTGYACTGCEVWDIHGDQGERGTVLAEFYANAMNVGASGTNRWMHHRGGRAIIINNTISRNISFNFTEYTAWSGNAGNPNNCGGYPAPDQINNTVYGNNVAGGVSDDPPTFTNSNTSSCGAGLSEDDYLVEGRDYWVATSGLEANRPGTCTDNTMYVATDTDKVFKCSPANTWTTFFTPYTYPHPLRS